MWYVDRLFQMPEAALLAALGGFSSLLGMERVGAMVIEERPEIWEARSSGLAIETHPMCDLFL